MRILSIDVGLKNLAYCVIEKDKDYIKVCDWGLIDVSEKIVPCDHCKNGAKYNFKDEYYCGIHKGKFKCQEVECVTKLNTKEECIMCKKICGYYKTSEGVMCSQHKNSFLNKQKKSLQLVPIKKESVMKVDVNILCERMAKKLDEKNFDRVDKIVIENQPVIKNPKMKTIQTFVSCYFVIRFNVDKKYNTQISFSLANNKLKYNIENTKKKLLACKTAKEKYTVTKQLGIDYALDLLNKDKERNKEWLKLFEEHKQKQDDLADALMQGYYFMYIKK